MGDRFKIRVAVYLILARDEKILLTLRQNTGWQDGNWGLPAGHLEAGESILQAAVREASEEVGINALPSDLKLVHVMHRMKEQVGDHEYLDFFFTTEKWAGTPSNCEPDKCSEIKWIQVNALPQNLIPNVRVGIGKYLDKAIFSEMNFNG